MVKIQVLLEKNMHDSCLHFIPGVSNPDHGKCITLELYFAFEPSTGNAAFTLTYNNLIISGYMLH